MITKQYLIQGKVQSVGFRNFTQKEAILYNINGWVTNLPNGDVECLAMGTEYNIQLFEEQLHKGSKYSKVTNIIIKQINDSHVYSNFRIIE